MPVIAPPPPPLSLPACHATRLRLSADGRDGDFDGMSHSGVALSIRNTGGDCRLPARPVATFRDARGAALPATRRPGPAATPVRIAAGGRATIMLRWVSGPVFARNRRLRAAAVTVRVGGGTLRVPVAATLYAPAGRRATFDQTPARTAGG